MNVVQRLDRLLESGYAKLSADEIIVRLGALIPNMSASYLVNLRHDLQAIIPAPLQFTLLTGIDVIPPDPNIIYSPTRLPTVVLEGVSPEQVEVPQGASLQTLEQALSIEWHELRDEVCRLRLRFPHTVIPLAWTVKRVNAWIEGVDGDLVYEGQALRSILRARGDRYEALRWIIQCGDMTAIRNIILNAKGNYANSLQDDALFDQIRGMGGEVHVSAEMRGMRWHVFTYQGINKTPPVEKELLPEESSEVKKPSLKDYKSRLKLPASTTPQRRERFEINASLDDQKLMSELLKSVRENKQVVLKSNDYARFAKIPVSAYLDASASELSAIWTGLVRLAEVHQTTEWKPRLDWATKAVDRLFTETQLQAPKSRYTINLAKFHTVEGYRFAADDWIMEHKRNRNDQNLLVTGAWLRNMRLLRRELEVYRRFPIINYTLELVQAVTGEPETGFNSPLLQLDEIILLLALLMRLNVYYPQIAARVRANADFGHKNVPQPEVMLYTAKQACPALLLWALTWVETFSVYDQAQRG